MARCIRQPLPFPQTAVALHSLRAAEESALPRASPRASCGFVLWIRFRLDRCQAPKAPTIFFGRRTAVLLGSARVESSRKSMPPVDRLKRFATHQYFGEPPGTPME